MKADDNILASMRVDGQVALVTGAGRGIGRGCALALAEAGAEVIAMARTEDEIVDLVGVIEAKGGSAGENEILRVLDPRVAAAERNQALAKLKKAQTASGGSLSAIGGAAAQRRPRCCLTAWLSGWAMD